MRKRLQGTAGASLSDADIIAVLGAYSVKVCKGPDIPVKFGRLDVDSEDPTGRLPSEKAPVSELKACFAGAGLSTNCLLYTSPSPRDRQKSRMPSSA